MAHAGRVEVGEDQRKRLEEMARSRTLAARKVLRAKIILRRAKGESPYLTKGNPVISTKRRGTLEYTPSNLPFPDGPYDSAD